MLQASVLLALPIILLFNICSAIFWSVSYIRFYVDTTAIAFLSSFIDLMKSLPSPLSLSLYTYIYIEKEFFLMYKYNTQVSLSLAGKKQRNQLETLPTMHVVRVKGGIPTSRMAALCYLSSSSGIYLRFDAIIPKSKSNILCIA